MLDVSVKRDQRGLADHGTLDDSEQFLFQPATQKHGAQRAIRDLSECLQPLHHSKPEAPVRPRRRRPRASRP